MSIEEQHYNYYRAMRYYFLRGDEENALRMYKCLLNKNHTLTRDERRRCSIKYLIKELV